MTTERPLLPSSLTNGVEKDQVWQRRDTTAASTANQWPYENTYVEVRKNPPAVGLTATKVKFRKPTSGRLPNQHQP